MLLVHRVAGRVRDLVRRLVVFGTGDRVRDVPHMLLVHRLVPGRGDGHLVALHLRPAHRHGVLANMLLVHGAAHRLADHLVLVLDHRAGDRVAVLTQLRFRHGTEDGVLFLPHRRVVNGFVGCHRNFFRDHALAYPVADR